MASVPRQRRRGLARVIGLGLAAAILTVSGVGYAAAVSVTDQIRHVDVFNGLSNRPLDGGGQNILLVGSDDRAGLSHAEKVKLHVGTADYGRHTDTIMIAHIADNGTVAFVSIPRDSYVEIPSFTDADGRTTPASHQKINAAYDIGGPQLIVRTVEAATGVHLDHYAEINFVGFVAMVDAVGGVEMTIPTPIHDEKAGLNLPAGTTNLSGPQALAYVRARYFDPTADLGRMKRQQAFVGALMQKATSPAVLMNPMKLMAFANAAAASLTVDEKMGRTQLWGLFESAQVGSASDVSFQTVPLAGEANKAGVGSVVTWDTNGARQLFSLLNSGQPLTGDHAVAKGATVEVAPANIRVQVFNGSDRSGLASKARDDLQAAGYVLAGPARNASSHAATKTVIQYDPRYDRSLLTLQASLPQASATQVKGLGRTFSVIVGSEYDGLASIQVAN